MAKPKPNNIDLYNRVKEEVKTKFDAYPSIYANSWLVREYKKRGGTYSGKKNPKEGLSRWFDQEEWINVCKLPEIVKCGRPTTKDMPFKEWKKTYPYCRPRYKASSDTPMIASSLTKSEIRNRCKSKKRNPLKRIVPKRIRKRSMQRKSKKRSVKRKSNKRRIRKSKKRSVKRKSRNRRSS